MSESGKRPWTVLSACVVSVGISVWDIVSSMSEEAELIDSGYFLALLAALMLIPLLFTIAAFFRRNWGRIGLAVITVLAFLSVPLFALFPEMGTLSIDAETVLYSVAEVVVLVLLFVPPSNAWYRIEPLKTRQGASG
jgi:hypothetical protein